MCSVSMIFCGRPTSFTMSQKYLRMVVSPFITILSGSCFHAQASRMRWIPSSITGNGVVENESLMLSVKWWPKQDP